MTVERNEGMTKVSVKIWRPIIEKLDIKLDQACLRRDAYLARLLTTEVDLLNAEVSLPNSVEGERFIAAQLDALDRKLVSLSLPLNLVAKLNRVCRTKRIVRDAFFNRLFLLLAASPEVIDALLFDGKDSRWRQDVWSELKHDGLFFQNVFYPLEQELDPFWAFRMGLELENVGQASETDKSMGKAVTVVRGLTGALEPFPALYTVVLEQKIGAQSLLGLNCHMPDRLVPNHPEATAHSAKLDELLANFVTLD